MTTRVEITPPTFQRIYLAAFGTVWCGFLAGAVVATHSPLSIVLLVMIAFGGTLCYRMFRLAAIADDNALLVRNHFATKRLERREIEDFRVGRAPGVPFGKVIHVLLRNGEIMTLDVTMRPWYFGMGPAKLEKYVRSFREWLGATSP